MLRLSPSYVPRVQRGVYFSNTMCNGMLHLWCIYSSLDGGMTKQTTPLPQLTLGEFNDNEMAAL